MFPSSGVYDSTSSSKNDIEEIPNLDINVSTNDKSSMEELIEKEAVNSDTGIQTTYNPIMDFSEIVSLQGYAESYPISVVFYNQNFNSSGKRYNVSDFNVKNDLYKNFTRIDNFELRLSGELDYEYDTENAISNVTGEAYLYPLFEVYEGDVFLYKLSDNRIGLFKFGKPTRLSMHKDSLHKAPFALLDFPDANDLAELNKLVDVETVFIKEESAWNGKVGILQTDTFRLKQKVWKYTHLIAHYIYLRHYDRVTLKSIVRPDGVYDPYAANFISKYILGMSNGDYINTLLYRYVHSENSILYLLNHLDSSDLSLVKKTYNKQIKTFTYDATEVSSLIGKEYICLEDEVPEINPETPEIVPSYYIFSKNFYDNLPDQCTGFEKIVLTFINERKINSKDLMTLVVDYKKLTDVGGFYQLIIYLYLLHELNRSII